MRLKKITSRWLLEHHACSGAMEAFKRQRKMEQDPIRLMRKCMRRRRYDWVEWLLENTVDNSEYDRLVDVIDASNTILPDAQFWTAMVRLLEKERDG